MVVLKQLSLEIGVLREASGEVTGMRLIDWQGPLLWVNVRWSLLTWLGRWLLEGKLCGGLVDEEGFPFWL